MKKNYITLFTLLCVLGAFAQLVPIGTPINQGGDYVTQVNTIFQHLEKNRVPHGILTDFGLDYVDLTAYAGSLPQCRYKH